MTIQTMMNEAAEALAFRLNDDLGCKFAEVMPAGLRDNYFHQIIAPAAVILNEESNTIMRIFNGIFEEIEAEYSVDIVPFSYFTVAMFPKAN